MRNLARTSIALAGVSLLALTLAGCSDEPLLDPSPASTTPAAPTGDPDPSTNPDGESAAPERPAEEETPDPEPSAPAIASVPGYAVGEFPAIPMFVLPDLARFDEELTSDETRDFFDDLSGLKGVTVAPAHCDESGEVTHGIQSSLLYGDERGNVPAPDGSTVSYPIGAGTLTLNDETGKGEADGFGSFSEGRIAIRNYGDGTGSYVDDDVSIQLYGDGSGSYASDSVTIQNDGTGAGNYFGGGVKIQNNGDGSGSYSDADITIQNIGDGTGYVNAEPVTMDPLPPLPPLGVFPTLPALQPTASCGTLVSISNRALFDTDRTEVRPDATLLVDTVAEELGGDIPEAFITAYGDEALGSERADAIATALEESGATARLVSRAGNDAPVAPIEMDGSVNPAGAELNDRVEVFIPAAETPAPEAPTHDEASRT